MTMNSRQNTNPSNNHNRAAAVDAWLEQELSGVSLGIGLGREAGTGRAVSQATEDRFRHMLIIGRTGAGKSNHIQQLERQDIRSGAGCFILAAHEDDALYPLSCVPEGRLDDVVLIDASNPRLLPCMNPLDVRAGDSEAASRAVEDILELLTMDSYFEWSGPRYESYLRGGIGLLLQAPDPSAHCIADLNRVFTDPDYVKGLLRYCTDEEVYNFWTRIFPPAQRSSDAGDTVSWFLAKASRFAHDRTLSHFFGAGRSTVDIQDVVDNGKILIAYVPESRVGKVAARTVSKWLLMQLRDAIMNRRDAQCGWDGLDYGRYERADAGAGASSGLDPFFVYVDEFAKFACEDFTALLAEARKQRAGFVLSAQTMSQTRTFDIKTGRPGKLEEAILGNVGSVVCYPVGSRDAELLACQFDVDAEKLKRIRRYRPLARLCIDNRMARPREIEVEMRPEPGNPSAARRIARNMELRGVWVKVSGEGADDASGPETAEALEEARSRHANAIDEARNLRERHEERRRQDAKSDEWLGAGMSFRKGSDNCPADGLGHAYGYWEPDGKSYRILISRAQAEDEARDSIDAVWVSYENGSIDHVASEEECRVELEMRVGERISAGVPEERLEEFDAITDGDEAIRWLEENRPDFRDIAKEEKAKMEQARVLDEDTASCASF